MRMIPNAPNKTPTTIPAVRTLVSLVRVVISPTELTPRPVGAIPEDVWVRLVMGKVFLEFGKAYWTTSFPSCCVERRS
jgi:hypothetical protein